MAPGAGRDALTGVSHPVSSYGVPRCRELAARDVAAACGQRAPGDFEPFAVGSTSAGRGVCALALSALGQSPGIRRPACRRPHRDPGSRRPRFEYNPGSWISFRAPARSRRQALPWRRKKQVPSRRSGSATGIWSRRGERCPDPGQRCYPLGGRTFHVLGDVRTRVNWTASNTSFVERDAAARLRGFDDRAANVRLTDSSGRSTYAVSRDYRDLVPLLRHRFDSSHPAVERLRSARATSGSRSMRISRCACPHRRGLRAEGQRQGGGCVLDPDPGAVLASASYPGPSASGAAASEREEQGMLSSIARYGSTPQARVQLVVAMAALRRNPATSGTATHVRAFRTAAWAPRSRGGHRPVRDDVLIRKPTAG